MSSVGGELANYRDYLTHHRATVVRLCENLTPDQLATRSVPPSTMSLLGLVRHLARVEHFWFRCVLAQTPTTRLFDDGDAGFADVAPTDAAVAQAWGAWHEEVRCAEAWLDAQDDADLGRVVTFREGAESAPARDLLVHMVEEYARHCGHADLLRECLDGATGI